MSKAHFCLWMARMSIVDAGTFPPNAPQKACWSPPHNNNEIPTLYRVAAPAKSPLVISIGRRMSGASSDAVGYSHASLHKSFISYREYSQPILHRSIANGLVQRVTHHGNETNRRLQFLTVGIESPNLRAGSS